MTDTNEVLSRYYDRPVTTAFDALGRPVVVCAKNIFTVIDGGDVGELPAGFEDIIRKDRELAELLNDLDNHLQEVDAAMGYTPESTSNMFFFSVRNAGTKEVLTTGYVHPGVGVSYALDCSEATRNAIDAAAIELSETPGLSSITVCERLYEVVRKW